MRISTGMIYSSGLESMQHRTSNLLRTQQQLSSGRRMISPSDDPVAAARALEVSQSKTVNANQAITRGNAKDTLGIIDGQLDSVSDLLARVRELAVQGGSASLADSDRKSIAVELRARFQELVALGNSRDGNGLYLFGGYQTNNQPFAGSVENGVAYGGDDGARTLRVSGSRELAISNSGNDIFMQVKNGNGLFIASHMDSKSANSASASVDAVRVTNAALWNDGTNSGNIELKFWVDKNNVHGGGAGARYYDLIDKATGKSLFTGTPSDTGSETGVGSTFTHLYTSGAAINFSGLAAAYAPPGNDFGASITVRGVPGDGDTFAITRKAATSAVVGMPTITDQGDWDAAADLEIRFWVDQLGDIGPAGATYYDLVDTGSGNSLFTGGASTAGVPGNTYTHAYTAGVAIDFDQAPVNYGAEVTLLGTPANGDSYAVTKTGGVAPFGISVAAKAAAGQISAEATRTTDTQTRAVIDKGAVTDPVAWKSSANSGNLEVRFWVDAAGSNGAAGQIYYDLVDAATGDSLLTNTASTAGGTGNTYLGTYASPGPVTIPLQKDAVPTPISFGASVQISGTPASGDAFTIVSSDDQLGNGFFVTEAKKSTQYNVGSGLVGRGEIVDAARWNHAANSRNLEVRFWQDSSIVPAVVYYDLVDAETEKSLFTNGASTAGGAGNTYTHVFKPGDNIRFAGLQVPDPDNPAQTVTDFGISVTIEGTPASGDAFSIKASKTESVFDTLTRLITTLESPKPPGTMGNVHLANEVARVLGNLSMAEDNILRVRASIGSRLSEVDDLDAVGQNLDLQYDETLSRLQDLDYADAITKLSRYQMELQAAQQSFVKISQLSLFSYL